MPENNDAIRAHVSDAYAKAVTSGEGACCRPTGTSGGKGVAAQWAGYTLGDSEGIPESAVFNSFGCGNPLAFAEVQPGQTVLDLGSGAGFDLLLAGKQVGPKGKVIGVDMTDAMLLEARENIARAGMSGYVEVRKGLIEALPVDDSSVDWVISNCVINLSPEKDKVFAEVARVLKPGGAMRVSDLMVEDLPSWVRSDEHLYNTCIGGAVSEEDYLAGLRKAGLEDVRVQERMVYERSQIGALINSEVAEAGGGCGCCGEKLVDVGDVERAANDLQGKVISSVVLARKPL